MMVVSLIDWLDLQELASLIPQLEDTKRSQLSKNAVVEEAINHIRHLLATVRSSSELLASISAQNDTLLVENGQLRSILSTGSVTSPLTIGPPGPQDLMHDMLGIDCSMPDSQVLMPELVSPPIYNDDMAVPRSDGAWAQFDTNSFYATRRGSQVASVEMLSGQRQ